MVDIAEVCQALQLEEEVVDIVRVYWQLKRKVRRSSVCIASTFLLCYLLSVSRHCLCILSPSVSVVSPPVYRVPFCIMPPFFLVAFCLYHIITALYSVAFFLCRVTSCVSHPLSVLRHLSFVSASVCITSSPLGIVVPSFYVITFLYHIPIFVVC